MIGNWRAGRGGHDQAGRRSVGAALLERVTSWAAEIDVELLVVWPSDESVGF